MVLRLHPAAGVLITAAALHATAAAAADPAAPAAAAAAAEPEPKGSTEAVLESTRSSVRSSAEWLASGVDSWFGDKPFSDGGKVTDGVLRLRLVKRQRESLDASLRFNARFRLPNLEERAYLFVGRDDENEIVNDTPDTFSRQQRLQRDNTTDRSFFAGLGLRVQDLFDFRIGFRGGLKPYAQARYTKDWSLTPADVVTFRETVFWSVDDRVGSTTAVSYEHAFSSTLSSRWLNSATISQRSEKFEWSSSLGLFKSFGDQRTLAVELLAFGKQGDEVGVTDYGIDVKWEQPIYKDWLFGEVIVGQFWPRADTTVERRRAWAFGGGLRLTF